MSVTRIGEGSRNMNALTNRNLSLGWLVLLLWGGFAGCQSMTPQLTTWNFPPGWEKSDEDPLVPVERRALPPLPTGFDQAFDVRSSPESRILTSAITDSENPKFSQSQQPKFDPAVNRTSFEALPNVSQGERDNFASFAGAGRINPPDYGERSVPAMSSIPAQLESPSVSASIQPVALDEKQTRRVVKDIVGATDAILRTGATEGLDSPSDEKYSELVTGEGAKLPPKATLEHLSSKPSTVVLRIEPKNKAPVPPLETLSEEERQGATKSGLSIPKAAVCRSVQGRGRFEALPAQMWKPGSTVLIYWELDGLERDLARKTSSFSVVVELIAADRDTILASVRESVEAPSADPAEGDYAALRWTLPAEIPNGDYKIRITATDKAGRQNVAMATVDLPLGRALASSGFVLP